jgi:hypothetical protein
MTRIKRATDVVLTGIMLGTSLVLLEIALHCAAQTKSSIVLILAGFACLTAIGGGIAAIKIARGESIDW